MADRFFTLSSGRRIGMSSAGDALSRRLVLLCHPTPGASGFDPNPVVSEHGDAHLLSFDRPGYGSSDPLREGEPSSAQARADDIAEYLGKLRNSVDSGQGLQFHLVGWGFGAVIALSLLTRHPTLFDRAALVGFNRRALGPPPTGHASAPYGLLESAGTQRFGRDSLGVDDEDPSLSFPGAKNRLDRMLTEAAAQGTTGVEADCEAMRDRTWAGELGRVVTPTALIYGDDERATSPALRRSLKRRIPHSRLVRVEGAGDLTIVSVWRQILEYLASEGR